jgi:hypothetical protein
MGAVRYLQIRIQNNVPSAGIPLSASGLMVITIEPLEVVNFAVETAHKGMYNLDTQHFYVLRNINVVVVGTLR